jgi:two-component system phosphate regulon sensor histidine kinase PhoR
MLSVRLPGPGLLVLIGAVVGAFIASALKDGEVVLGISLGALVGALISLSVEKSRISAFVDWLRDPAARPGMRFEGLATDVAYRVVKLMQAHEKALHQEQHALESFRAAIDASPNGVLVLNAMQQIEWCNRTAAAHFGIDPRRDRLQPVTHMVRSPEFVAHLRSGDFEQTVRFPGPDGRRLGIFVRPFSNGMFILSQDLTENDRHERMRREFIANVSHELHTPLTVLSGFIETLRADQSDAEASRAMMGLMHEQADRMKSLVNDLLVLADLEGRAQPPINQWVEAKAIIDQALQVARERFPDRHPITVSDGPGATEIAGHRDELNTALNHLISNACQYSEPAAPVSLSLSVPPEGGVRITVVDRGPGIASEHLPRLSERFYRVDTARSRETGGTGLGLAIVKQILMRHDGALDIESAPGQGSRFTLVFPASRTRVTAPDTST